MKFLLACLLIGISIGVGFSQTYSYLTLKSSNLTEDEVSLPITGLKLTFANGECQVKTASGSTSYPLPLLQSMFFSTEPTGITDRNSAPVIQYSDDVLATDGKFARVSVYNLDGRCLISTFCSRMNISFLRRGIYLLRVDNRTFKIFKQ